MSVAEVGQLALTPEVQPAGPLVARDESSSWLAMIERLATSPDVNVDVLERMLAMQERVMARSAEAEYNAAFSVMQPEIPVIVERHEGDGGKWSYAALEDIIEVVRPILARHGFSLNHKTEWPNDKTLRVIGILKHRAGHSERSEFQAEADKTGSKNGIQALGSSESYGKRYTTKDLLCIVTRGADDDGAKSEMGKQPDAPEGYDAWLAALEGVASEGMAAFANAWGKSKQEYRAYLSKTAPKLQARIKEKAAKAGKAGA